MLEAITTSIELGKPCAAICHGPWMFCSARFPNGQPVCHQRQCTAFVAIKDDLMNAGAQFVDAPVVVDGPLITRQDARGLDSLLPRAHRGPHVICRQYLTHTQQNHDAIAATACVGHAIAATASRRRRGGCGPK